MKKNKVGILKINIKIGDKDITLSPEEAQELRQILDDTFGPKTVFLPSMPIIIEWPVAARPYRSWEPITWTCSTAGKTEMYLSTSIGAAGPDDQSMTVPVM